MRGTANRTHDADLEACWPLRLIMTDAPESWSSLVEQIAELEELLSEAVLGDDAGTPGAAERIRELLEDKRRSLAAIDVG